MLVIFDLLHDLTENLMGRLIALFCKQLLHVLKNPLTSDFKLFSSTLVKVLLTLCE